MTNLNTTNREFLKSVTTIVLSKIESEIKATRTELATIENIHSLGKLPIAIDVTSLLTTLSGEVNSLMAAGRITDIEKHLQKRMDQINKGVFEIEISAVAKLKQMTF